MGMIRLGIALIVIGLLLSLTGFFELAAVLQYIGWILLGVGIILTLLYYIGGMFRRAP